MPSTVSSARSDLGRAGTGRKPFEAGLLAPRTQGILYVDEVNLPWPDHLVDARLRLRPRGVSRVERDASPPCTTRVFLLWAP